jgi:hypothetical protein
VLGRVVVDLAHGHVVVECTGPSRLGKCMPWLRLSSLAASKDRCSRAITKSMSCSMRA